MAKGCGCPATLRTRCSARIAVPRAGTPQTRWPLESPVRRVSAPGRGDRNSRGMVSRFETWTPGCRIFAGQRCQGPYICHQPPFRGHRAVGFFGAGGRGGEIDLMIPLTLAEVAHATGGRLDAVGDAAATDRRGVVTGALRTLASTAARRTRTAPLATFATGSLRHGVCGQPRIGQWSKIRQIIDEVTR